MGSVEWIVRGIVVRFRLGYVIFVDFGDSDRLWMCSGDVVQLRSVKWTVLYCKG